LKLFKSSIDIATTPVKKPPAIQFSTGSTSYVSVKRRLSIPQCCLVRQAITHVSVAELSWSFEKSLVTTKLQKRVKGIILLLNFVRHLYERRYGADLWSVVDGSVLKPLKILQAVLFKMR
jgi:hypothetical protein